MLATLLLVAIGLRLFWLWQTDDYQADAWLRTINMMTLVYHPIWPPGYFYLAKPFYVLFGNPNLVLRGTSFVTGVGSILVLYALVLEISDNERVAFLSAFFVTVLPTHVSHSVQAMSEMPFLFLWLISLYAFVRNRILLSAGILAVTTMVRYEAWPFVLLLPAYLVIRAAVAAWRDEQRLPAGLMRSLKEGFVFLSVSGVVPVAYLLINRFTTGEYLKEYFLWILTPDNPNAARETSIAISRSDISWLDFVAHIVDLFVHGLINVPTDIEPIVGQAYQVRPFSTLEQLYQLGGGMLLLIACLACVGVWHAYTRRYRAFGVFAIVVLVSVAVLVLILAHGVFRPYTRYTFWPLSLITVLAAVGIHSLTVCRPTRLLGYGIAPVLFLGLLLVSTTSGYSGPEEPARVAAYVTDLVGPSTVVQRLQRVGGLTGPDEQTEQLLRLAGSRGRYLEPFLSRTSEKPVLLVDGGNEPLDTRRFYMLQALTDLSYDQFERLTLEEGSIPIAADDPFIVIVATDSLESHANARAALIAWLSAGNYSMEFERGPLQVWTLQSSGGQNE